MKYSKVYPWVVVGLLWVVALLNYMDRQMLSTMRPSMQGDIAELQSATNFGSLMAIFLWVYGFMSPISGIVADKFNKKWLIVISLFIWSLVTFMMGYAVTYNELYWLRAIMGISEAIYIPAALSLIADYHLTKSRSLAVGIHMTGLYMGQALGGFGATISAEFSWHTTFHMFGFIGIFYSVILILFLKNKAVVTNDLPSAYEIKRGAPFYLFKGLGILLANFSFWIILFYFSIQSLPGWATKNWLPTLFAQNLGVDMSRAGPISTITIACSSFLGVIAGGIISDRWVQKDVRGRIYTSAIGLTLSIPSLLLLGFGTSLYHILAAVFFFGLGYGMFDANNMPILCQFVPRRYRATGYGLMNMTGVFFGALVTDFFGRSTDAGNLGRSFAMLSIIVLLALVAQMYFLRPKVRDFADT
jgi:MFS transporter, ACS family, D-galactonate transporter